MKYIDYWPKRLKNKRSKEGLRPGIGKLNSLQHASHGDIYLQSRYYITSSVSSSFEFAFTFLGVMIGVMRSYPLCIYLKRYLIDVV